MLRIRLKNWQEVVFAHAPLISVDDNGDGTVYIEGGVYKDGEITWTKEKVAADETFEVTFKVSSL